MKKMVRKYHSNKLDKKTLKNANKKWNGGREENGENARETKTLNKKWKASSVKMKGGNFNHNPRTINRKKNRKRKKKPKS